MHEAGTGIHVHNITVAQDYFTHQLRHIHIPWSTQLPGSWLCWQPTQAQPRWTGLQFLTPLPSITSSITSTTLQPLLPPSLPRSLGLSEAPGSFVLCKMECNDQLRRKFLQRFKMEFGGRPPVCLLNFLTFLPTAKTNSCPLWKRPERFDC